MDIQKLVERRAEFLRQHRRIEPGVFPRDFIAAYGLSLVRQIERFDQCGAILCTPECLLGYAGSESERKRLQRGLRQLVDNGTLMRLSRSEFQIREDVRPSFFHNHQLDSG